MNRTPQCASDIAPGRGIPDPPPTTAARVAVWCGALYGGLVSNGRSAGSVPATEWMHETSSAASSSRSGSNPGSRSASIVFPAPGGPDRNRWCPPAADTSSARRGSS